MTSPALDPQHLDSLLSGRPRPFCSWQANCAKLVGFSNVPSDLVKSRLFLVRVAPDDRDLTSSLVLRGGPFTCFDNPVGAFAVSASHANISFPPCREPCAKRGSLSWLSACRIMSAPLALSAIKRKKPTAMRATPRPTPPARLSA